MNETNSEQNEQKQYIIGYAEISSMEKRKYGKWVGSVGDGRRCGIIIAYRVAQEDLNEWEFKKIKEEAIQILGEKKSSCGYSRALVGIPMTLCPCLLNLVPTFWSGLHFSWSLPAVLVWGPVSNYLGKAPKVATTQRTERPIRSYSSLPGDR